MFEWFSEPRYWARVMTRAAVEEAGRGDKAREVVHRQRDEASPEGRSFLEDVEAELAAREEAARRKQPRGPRS
jgi:hypothetical protein